MKKKIIYDLSIVLAALTASFLFLTPSLAFNNACLEVDRKDPNLVTCVRQYITPSCPTGDDKPNSFEYDSMSDCEADKPKVIQAGWCGQSYASGRIFCYSKYLDKDHCVPDPKNQYTLLDFVSFPACWTNEAANKTIIQNQQQTTQLIKDLQVSKPILEINLPQLKFSDVKNQLYTDEAGNSYLYIPFVGEFISALYNFGIGIVSVVAVVMIIIQGARIVASGGGEQKVATYKKIGQAVLGLFIAWGSYAILYNINPDLVNFKALKVRYIIGQKLSAPEEPSEETINGTASSDGYCIDTKTLVVIKDIPNIKSQADPNQVVQDLISALKKAGELAIQTTDPQTGKKFDGLVVVSAVRNLAKQTALFEQAVKKYGSEEVARNHVGKPQGCATGSSHLLGRAVDIHLMLDGKELQQIDMTEDRINLFQDAIMTPAGWTRYCPEWWHFEFGSPNQALRSTKCDRPYGTGNSHLK